MASVRLQIGWIALAAAACLLAAAVAALAAPSTASAGACERWGNKSPGALRPAQARKATLCLVNRERAQAGKPGLSVSSKLQRAAQKHSSLMAQTGCFSHDCPGEGGLGARLSNVGYLIGGLLRWAYGECLAYGTASRGTPRSIVQAWMDSPPHRATMLEGSFRDAGVGFDVRSGNVGYHTLDIGLRKD